MRTHFSNRKITWNSSISAFIGNCEPILFCSGSFFSDASDRKNRTRFGLETIVEEIHDQSEDIAYGSKTVICNPNPDLAYNEIEINLWPRTNEKLRQPEEFHHFVSLTLKPRSSARAPDTVTDKLNFDERRNLILGKTMNPKVEYTLKDIKDAKYFLKGGERCENGKNPVQEDPGECDNMSYEVKSMDNSPYYSKSFRSHGHHDMYIPHEIAPSDVSMKMGKYCRKAQLPKSRKKHGGSKKYSKFRDEKKQEWLEKYNLTSISHAIHKQLKGCQLIFLKFKENAEENWDLPSNIRGIMAEIMNLRNALTIMAGIIFMFSFISATVYQPSSTLVKDMIRRLGRRRSPFQEFCDTIFNILCGIIP